MKNYTKPGPKPLPLRQRLMRRLVVNRTNDCWEWQGGTTRGYGVVMYRVKGRRIFLYAHRLSYHIFRGSTNGQLVCHKCDNPRCANPEHLFLGTHADNTHDAMRKGRLKAPPHPRGEDHPRSKITWKRAAIIRRLIASGKTGSEIGRRFGVSSSTVSLIGRGKLWSEKKLIKQAEA